LSRDKAEEQGFVSIAPVSPVVRKTILPFIHYTIHVARGIIVLSVPVLLKSLKLRAARLSDNFQVRVFNGKLTFFSDISSMIIYKITSRYSEELIYTSLTLVKLHDAQVAFGLEV
jgi:hypothetical protein